MSSPTTKPCPFCAEEIMPNAIKCKHCGEYLSEKEAPNYQPIKPGLLGPSLSFTPTVYCSNCKKTGKAKLQISGSLLIELVLWIAFLIPGLLYHLWRNSTMRYGCSNCGFAAVTKAV